MFVIFIDTSSDDIQDLPINLSARCAPDDVEVLNDSCLLTPVKLPLIITPSKRSFNQLTLPSPQRTPTRYKRKIKLLQQKVRRQNKTIKSLKDLLKNIRNQGMLSAEYEDIMLDKFGGMSAEIFKHELKNIGRKPKGRRYSTDIKEFALTLHYYSPKAYAFCRLDFCLLIEFYNALQKCKLFLYLTIFILY